MALPLILTINAEVKVGYSAVKAFEVTMLDASNKQFTATISPAQKNMFMQLKTMNIPSRDKDRLWDMFEAFGEEEYSRGYDAAEFDAND
jgi:hypothetical protein